MKRLCVFCGSNVGANPVFRERAHALGELLAERGIGLVTGAGMVGLMGVIADAALARGGEVIGVIPHGLMEREVGHTGLTKLHVVNTMHERKTLMHELSDAFITLPGGWGSFEELLETVTWTQLGIHGKPCGLLNWAGYYEGFLAQIDRAVSEGFIKPRNRELLLIDEEAGSLLQRFESWTSPVEDNWLDPSQV
jgi:uncharacterized protein (TIGR00730 family)